MNIRFQLTLFPYLLLTLAFALVVEGQVTTVVSNKLHVITYEIRGDDMVFVMESIQDFTDGRESKEFHGLMDSAGLSVDRDDNGVIDSGKDVDFGFVLETTTLCTSLLYRADSLSICGKFRSGARLKVDFRSSPNEAKPHPVVEYTIPKVEISPAGGPVGIVYRLYSQGGHWVFYPEKDKDEPYFSFKKTLRLQL